jgi:flagellar protein FliS
MTTEELLNQQASIEDNENSAVKAYKTNNLQTESKMKLVEAMYEGILNFNRNAIKAIEEKNIEDKVHWINKSTTIFAELITALDPDAKGTIAAYLEGLYKYQIQLLVEANKNNDISKIEQVNKVVIGLLDAWRDEMERVAKQ